MHHLYLKTHNNTGLKYLGQTSRNPYTYNGSGSYWLRHLKKYGNNVSTEILFSTESKDELVEIGIEYSSKWNIVESSNFANLRIENGDGGDTSQCEAFIEYISKGSKLKGRTYEDIHGIEKAKHLRESRSNSNKNRGPRSQETKNKISKSTQGRVPWNKGKPCPNPKRPEIDKHIENFLKSGLTRKEYSKKYNINYNSFKRWVKGL